MALIDKLTAIADAIRGKTGKTEEMTLDQMVTEIDGIQVGGGDDELVTEILTGQLSGTYRNDTITKLAGGVSNQDNLYEAYFPNVTTLPTEYAFHNSRRLNYVSLPKVTALPICTFVNTGKLSGLEIDIPNLKTIGRHAFESSGLIRADFPLVTSLDRCVFLNCGKLEYVNLPCITTIPFQTGYSGFFSGCSKLVTVNLPKVETVTNTAFYQCSSLPKLDLPCAKTIGTQAFYFAKVLTTLILRSDTVCTLSNTNAFANSPFASNGTGGTVYVPQALIEQYQQATNWSTLYAAGTCNFVAIEGSEYE